MSGRADFNENNRHIDKKDCNLYQFNLNMQASNEKVITIGGKNITVDKLILIVFDFGNLIPSKYGINLNRANKT